MPILEREGELLSKSLANSNQPSQVQGTAPPGNPRLPGSASTSRNSPASVAAASGPPRVPVASAATVPPGRADASREVTAGKLQAESDARRRQMPSWLASFVVHLILLVLLAVIPLRQIVNGPLTFFLGESAGEVSSKFDLAETQDSDSQLLESSDLSPLETPDASEPLKQLVLPEPELTSTPVEVQTVTPDDTPLESLPHGLVMGLAGRSGTLKDSLLKQFGGTAETEAAVELGLAWLARQQNSDGSWSLLGPYPAGGAYENRTAATAMALNAFLGAGYTHKSGKYSAKVTAGLKWLLARQDSSGFFAAGEPSQQYMYAQAIASIAVIEAYGMTEDRTLQLPAQAAIKFAEESQSKLRGWRYAPREDADLSVTGWYVMVLATGQMAGLTVDRHLFKTVNSFLDSVSFEDYSRYSYTQQRGPSLTMTAEGMLCRIYLGWPKDHPALQAAVRDDLLANLPDADAVEGSVYYTYYATQVLHHVGGDSWKTWNAAMRTALPDTQIKIGPDRGSWTPGSDMFGDAGGRLYVTCLNLYCLEVYYRHLALYKP